MASGLNSRNAMVNVLDDVHYEAKQERFQFVKYCIITGSINAIVCGIAFTLMNSYIRAGVHFFGAILLFLYIIRDSVRKLNLKEISGIIFDNAEYTHFANNELVFSATRNICEMKGIIKGRRSMINVIHLLSLISVIIEAVEYFLGGLI